MKRSLAYLVLTLAACGRHATPSPPRLGGTWQDLNADDPGAVQYLGSVDRFYAFKDGTLTVTINAYEDRARAAKTLVDVIEIPYTLGSSSDQGVSSIDLAAPAKHTRTLLSDDAVAQMNQARDCGATDWSRGVARDVSGCHPLADLNPVPRADYDIVGVEGGVLYLGDKSETSTDGSTPARRPTSLAKTGLNHAAP